MNLGQQRLFFSWHNQNIRSIFSSICLINGQLCYVGFIITLHISYIWHKRSKCSISFDTLLGLPWICYHILLGKFILSARFSNCIYKSHKHQMCLWLKNKLRNIHLQTMTIILNNNWEHFRMFSLELVLSLRGQHRFALCKSGASTALGNAMDAVIVFQRVFKVMWGILGRGSDITLTAATLWSPNSHGPCSHLHLLHPPASQESPGQAGHLPLPAWEQHFPTSPWHPFPPRCVEEWEGMEKSPGR